MKVCRECHQEKPLSAFYKHSQMLDGHLNKCIECVKARIKKHREANLERVRAYDKKRSLLPHRVQARKEYAFTEAGVEARKKASSQYKERYPMKYAANVIVNNAVRAGVLIRSDVCSVCGSTTNIEGHHDDYTKPLDVRWLCQACHKEWHRANKPIYK